MTIPAWSTVTLCTDDDLRELEIKVLDWVAGEGSGKHWRDSAKEIIANELRQSFKTIELVTEAAEVLDLVVDVAPLKYASAYLSLHLICNNCSVGGDQWEKKAEMYWSKYREALPGAIGMLSLDLDESGTGDEAEKYYLTHGVRMTRGSV